MDLFNAINKGTIAIQEEFLPNFKILAEKIHNFKYKPAYQPSGFPYGNRYQAYPCYDSDKLENIDKKENKIILNTFNDTIGKPINNFFCRARYIVSKELANFGITINAIGPTPIKTDLIKSIPEQKLLDLINTQSIKRYGTFEDIINVINFSSAPI